MKKHFFKKLSDLETIEEKSFWVLAPLIAILGIISLTTAGSYSSIWPTVILAVFLLVIPAALMVFAVKSKRYHSAFPMLCISVGAISLPFTFIFSGGFLSGMPLFCVITTGITALCFLPKLRFISLIACLVGNTAAFVYVYLNGSPFPLQGTESILQQSDAIKAFYNDVLFSYYCCSIGLFIVIYFVTNDICKYKLNQDTLQRFFDSEKRKEIFKKSADAAALTKPEHKKAAILFADISNFTTITEKMSSDAVSEFLKEFFTTAGKYIHNTGGIIDKYIGDCVMAYWLDHEGENCVYNAAKAMLDLKQDIFRNTEYIFDKYGIELTFSVGIAYGDVIFGDIGSDTMHDFTVIGDAVNTASRIQDFAVSGEMLISDAAAFKVQDKIALEQIEEDHFFKGKNRPIDLYRILGFALNKPTSELEEKVAYGYKFQICGCRGSFPVSGLRFAEYGGETSCYVIKKDDYAVVVDCGTGLKNAKDLLKDCKKIDILLTHVHYDHILGFLMSKFPDDADIRIYGHFETWDNEENTLEYFMERPYWPVEIVNTKNFDVVLGESFKLNDDLSATFYLSDHPDQACIIKIDCKDKKVVFLADCEDATRLDPEIAMNADLLLYDGMFDDNDEVDHTGWGHGTWQSGIRYIKDKNVKKLLITHHSPEVGDHTLMEKELQAREMCPNASFAKTGDIYII